MFTILQNSILKYTKDHILMILFSSIQEEVKPSYGDRNQNSSSGGRFLEKVVRHLSEVREFLDWNLTPLLLISVLPVQWDSIDKNSEDNDPFFLPLLD